MITRLVLSSALAVGSLAIAHGTAAATIAGVAQPSASIPPADAAPFVGAWTLTLEGPNGPGTFALSVKVENDKVTAEIGSEQLPKQSIAEISRDKDRLILRYTFTWEGNPVDAVVTLAPAQDGKTAAQIEFAGGAYVMSGSATKKETPK